eukprot:361570-Chlamydomonas_euryale.AAC.2
MMRSRKRSMLLLLSTVSCSTVSGFLVNGQRACSDSTALRAHKRRTSPHTASEWTLREACIRDIGGIRNAKMTPERESQAALSCAARVCAALQGSGSDEGADAWKRPGVVHMHTAAQRRICATHAWS